MEKEIEKIGVGKEMKFLGSVVSWHSGIWFCQSKDPKVAFTATTREIPPFIKSQKQIFVESRCLSGSRVMTNDGREYSRAIEAIRKKNDGSRSIDRYWFDEKGNAVMQARPFDGHKPDIS